MNVLLSVTFACGVLIAVAHVVNSQFVAPVYDVVANLVAFVCAVAASLLLGHYLPAALSALAVLCWLLLARRTALALRRGEAPPGTQLADLPRAAQRSSPARSTNPLP